MFSRRWLLKAGAAAMITTTGLPAPFHPRPMIYRCLLVGTRGTASSGQGRARAGSNLTSSAGQNGRPSS